MVPFDNSCQLTLTVKCYAVPVMESSVGLRERKKLKTRAQLTDAAFRLFTERGFNGTTIEDIVEEVEVSPRTFFRYFDSKEDVVIGFFDDLGLQLRTFLAERPAEESPFEAVRNALGGLADVYTDQAERVMSAKALSQGTPAIRARLLDKHARWESGLTEELSLRLGVDPGQDPRPRLIAAVALAAFSTAVTSWCACAGRERLRELVATALETVGRGLDERSPRP